MDKDATGVADGTSWANAYVDLAQALVSQQSFNEVWVAEGTYLPGTIKSTSFILPPNVQVYGGFAGNETLRTQRNVVANPTILSGDIGTQGNSSDNSYHVVVPSQGSTLDGFTVKDGNASKNFGNDDRGIGAGLYADEATFVVSNCIFMDNRSRQRGGAVYLKDCNATFVDCNFTNNKGTGWGNGNGYAGAIYASGGRLILQSTSFTGNSADLEGGAIFAENTDLNSTNCVYSGNQNTVNNGGGAIRVDGGTLHDLNGTFTSNTSASSGGAIRVSNVSMTLTNSSFTSNQAAYSGGAVRSVDSNFTTRDCTFSLNSSTGSGGGAIDVENGSFHDANGSYSNNSAGLGGGAMRWTNTTGSVQDSNFTENQNPTSNGGGAISLSNASPGFSNCGFIRNGTLANNHGGAVKMLGSSSSFNDCIFTRNYSQANSGGAIYADGSSSPTFTDNEFRFNHSVQFGGAIFAESNLNFSGGLFLGNYANFGGGVATQGSVSCSFSNMRILGNESNSSSSSSGGFAYFNTGSTGSTFVNCVISGNKSLGRNGVYRPTGATRFVNCSIVGNQSGAEGGIALLFSGDSLALDNSIMWGNTATTGNEIYVNSGTASANYSLFNPAQSNGTISGSNNQNSDPLFTDANGADNVYGTDDDDLSLQSSSPALDNASSSVANYSTTDLLGRSRSGNPDRGAYEFIPAAPPLFTSSSSFSVQENQTNIGTVTATDANGDALSFSIGGGTDQAKFSIHSATGALGFTSPPDFENPTDSDLNNVYQVTVTVSDGTHSVQQA
ncbi:MAG: choice-of-anchor Q domain-containing protein, partial [Opitutae bacterium]